VIPKKIYVFSKFLIDNVVDKYVLLGDGTVILIDFANASGRRGTTIVNTFLFEAALHYAWKEIFGLDLYQDPETYFLVYGDNCIFATNRQVTFAQMSEKCLHANLTLKLVNYVEYLDGSPEFLSHYFKCITFQSRLFWVPDPVDWLKRVATLYLSDQVTQESPFVLYQTTCAILIDSFWNPLIRALSEKLLNDLERFEAIRMSDAPKSRLALLRIFTLYLGPLSPILTVPSVLNL